MRHHFVETCSLLGLTFFSDRWFRDVKPLYDAGHPLHTSELVLYEYCNREDDADRHPEDTSDLTVDWEPTDGKYRAIEDRLKRPLSDFFRHIRRLARDGLVLEEAVEAFIQHFEIREEAEPQIQAWFHDYFEDRAVTAQYVNDCAQDLVDRVLDTAKQNRATLRDAITVHDSRYDAAEETRRRWTDLPDHRVHEPDLSILVDATEIAAEEPIEYFVTGDSDLLAVQELATSYYGFSIISMQDEFAPVTADRIES